MFYGLNRALGTRSWSNDHGGTVLDWHAAGLTFNLRDGPWNVIKKKMRDTEPTMKMTSAGLLHATLHWLNGWCKRSPDQAVNRNQFWTVEYHSITPPELSSCNFQRHLFCTTWMTCYLAAAWHEQEAFGSGVLEKRCILNQQDACSHAHIGNTL